MTETGRPTTVHAWTSTAPNLLPGTADFHKGSMSCIFDLYSELQKQIPSEVDSADSLLQHFAANVTDDCSNGLGARHNFDRLQEENGAKYTENIWHSIASISEIYTTIFPSSELASRSLTSYLCDSPIPLLGYFCLHFSSAGPTKMQTSVHSNCSESKDPHAEILNVTDWIQEVIDENRSQGIPDYKREGTTWLLDLLIPAYFLAFSLHGPALFLISRIRIRRILSECTDSKSRNNRTPKFPKRIPNIPKSIPSRIHLPLRLTVTIIIFIIITFLCLRPSADDSGAELFSLANSETGKLHICEPPELGEQGLNEVRGSVRWSAPFLPLCSVVRSWSEREPAPGRWHRLSNEGPGSSTIKGFALLSATNLAGIFLLVSLIIIFIITQLHPNRSPNNNNTVNHSPISGGCKTNEIYRSTLNISQNPCSGDWKLKLKLNVVQLCLIQVVYFLLEFLCTFHNKFGKRIFITSQNPRLGDWKWKFNSEQLFSNILKPVERVCELLDFLLTFIRRKRQSAQERRKYKQMLYVCKYRRTRIPRPRFQVKKRIRPHIFSTSKSMQLNMILLLLMYSSLIPIVTAQNTTPVQDEGYSFMQAVNNHIVEIAVLLIPVTTILAIFACMMAGHSQNTYQDSRYPPGFDPNRADTYPFREYAREIMYWSLVNHNMNPAQKAAAVALRLKGSARRLVNQIPPSVEYCVWSVWP